MNTVRERLGLALGLIGMSLFAGTLPATRLAVAGFNPLFLTAARVALAGSAGFIVLLVTRRRLPPRAVWLVMFSAGSCTVLGFPLLMALALTTVPASHGGVVLGILPLAITAAAALFTHERPSPGFWLASAIGTSIVLTFVLFNGSGETFAAGDFLLLGTVAAGAIGYTLSGRLTALMPGWEVISWQVVIFLPLAVLAMFVLWPADIAKASISSWASLGYVGLVSQYAAFFVFNAALAMGGIARVGQVMLLQPFVIVALARMVNSEPFSIKTIFFALAVVATVLIGQKTSVTRR